MKRYTGGNPVSGGLYLNLRTLEFTQVTNANPLLPEPDADKYVRLPASAGLILAPVFGLVFIMALPLIGIAGILFIAAYKAGLTRNNLGRRVFQVFLARY